MKWKLMVTWVLLYPTQHYLSSIGWMDRLMDGYKLIITYILDANDLLKYFIALCFKLHLYVKMANFNMIEKKTCFSIIYVEIQQMYTKLKPKNRHDFLIFSMFWEIYLHVDFILLWLISVCLYCADNNYTNYRTLLWPFIPDGCPRMHYSVDMWFLNSFTFH